jgi:hypothetical protein
MSGEGIGAQMAFTSVRRNNGNRAGSRESLGLLLKVLNEHRPGVLEELNKVARFATATAESLGLSEYEVSGSSSRRAFTTSARSRSQTRS